MEIKNLKLKNFRNHRETNFKFNDISLILGENASGKSSVIEAIGFLSSGGSIRAEHDRECIDFEKDFSIIEGVCKKDDETINLTVGIQKTKEGNFSKKVFKVNGVVKSQNKFSGTLSTVIFTPLDMELIINGPALRRRFLDRAISQTRSEYRLALTKLGKVVRSRNRILEQINKEGRGYKELELYDDLFLEEAQTVHEERKKFFSEIKKSLEEYGEKLNHWGN